LRGSIKEIANHLSKKYKTNDPFVLKDYLKIKTYKWDFPEDTKGLYLYDKRQKFIFLNQSDCYDEQKITCGHEIGHSVIHTNVNYIFMKSHTLFNMNRFEKEANIFCVEFLIPDSRIQEYGNYTLQQIASAEKVPLELLKLKFI